MMAIWGDALDPVPAGPGGSSAPEVQADLCQSDVDRYIDMDGSSAEPVPPVSFARAPLPDDPAAEDDIVFLEATDALVTDAPADEAPADEAPADEAPADEAAALTLPDTDAAADAPEADDGGTEAPDEADALFADDADAADLPDAGDPDAAGAAPEPVTPSAIRVSEQARTDIATAFAEIVALSEDEKRALFS